MGVTRSALLALAVSLATPAVAQTVQIDTGTLAGTSTDGIEVFRGIPYAAPPMGERRWQPPAPAIPWSDIRDAKAFGAACPQAFRPGAPVLRTSEDCLTLSVWAPAKGAAKLPVLVWIFGGGFVGGDSSNPVNDGTEFAKRGVIVVAINHRFGALGYMAHPALSAASRHHVSGNYGLLDQIAALQWVRRNIAKFGGDPAKVTVGGQSSGGISVGALLASPQARGLFRAAIVHSAPITGLTPQPPTLDEAERFGAAFASVRGANTLAELKALTAEQLTSFSAPEAALSSPFRPTIDGDILPNHPLRLFASGSEAQVPLMIGSTAHESARITPMAPTREQFEAWVWRVYPDMAPAILSHYLSNDPATLRDRWLAVKSDDIFSGTRREALFHARSGNPTWVFRFDREPPGADQAKARAFHGADLPYVFGTLASQDRPWEAIDRTLSSEILRYWVNFVTTLDPNGGTLPQWPRFAPDTEMEMAFDATSKVVPLGHRDRLSIFEQPVLR